MLTMSSPPLSNIKITNNRHEWSAASLVTREAFYSFISTEARQSILFLLMRLMWPQQLQQRSSEKDWGGFSEPCFVGWVGGAHLWRTGWRSRSRWGGSARPCRCCRTRAGSSAPRASPCRPGCCSSAGTLGCYTAGGRSYHQTSPSQTHQEKDQIKKIKTGCKNTKNK